jgi:hypothetical protein
MAASVAAHLELLFQLGSVSCDIGLADKVTFAPVRSGL